jgi:hypothetical protein
MLNFHMYHRIHCARSERTELLYIHILPIFPKRVFKVYQFINGQSTEQSEPINGSLRVQNERGT